MKISKFQDDVLLAAKNGLSLAKQTHNKLTSLPLIVHWQKEAVSAGRRPWKTVCLLTEEVNYQYHY